MNLGPCSPEVDREGRWVLRRDVGGLPWWRLRWEGDVLQEVRIRLPDRRWLVLRLQGALHPVLGRAFPLALADDAHADGLVCAQVADCAWTAPQFLPAVDQPSRLPAGAGTGLLSFLAEVARAQGTACLRYRGPYPTGALFDTLLECFRVAEPSSAWASFRSAQGDLGTQGRLVEVPVEFFPDPLWRSWPEDQVCLQGRRRVERAWIQGRSFDRFGACRLIGDGPFVLRFVLAERELLTFGELDDRGRLLGGLRLEPPDLSAGRVPVALRDALGEALIASVPLSLRPLASAWWPAIELQFGTCGWSPASCLGDVLVLHAAWPLALQGHPPAEVLRHLFQALQPVFLAGLQVRVLRLQRAEDSSIG